MDIRRKTHRLDRKLYRGMMICAFTCCVVDKRPLFVDADTFHLFESKLLSSLRKNGCEAHVYLFMPDHLHLLVEGQSDDSDLWKCIVDFKQTTGFWLSSTSRGERWQHDFFDHVLRKEEDIEKQVRYILENPVRAGIVRDWQEYPYKGSTIYDFSQW